MDLMPRTAYAHPFPGNVLLNVERVDETGEDYLGDDGEIRTPVTDPADANVVSSSYRLGVKHFDDLDYHRPVLDIDFPAALIPSTTPGHFHLYLDAPMPWSDYEKLLNVLAEVGIIEPGYASVSIERKHTAVRVPWIRKGGDSLRGYAAAAREALVKRAMSAFNR